jgi:hypothetical protein
MNNNKINNNWISVIPRKRQLKNNKNNKTKKNNTQKVSLFGKNVPITIRNAFFNNSPDNLSDKLFINPERTTIRRNRTVRNNMEIEIFDDSYKKQIETGLVKFFKEGYQKNISKEDSDEIIINYINDFLIKYNIVISGGFILKCLGLFDNDTGLTSKDIDIYVPYTNLEDWNTINTVLQKLFDVRIKDDGTPDINYMRFRFFIDRGMYSVSKHYKDNNIEMDIIRCLPSKMPSDIIFKFDLSFCKNGYDGNKLWSFDKDAVLKLRPGKLNNKNVNNYIHRSNPRELVRLKKYINRGFAVQYKDPTTGDMIDIKRNNI